MYAVIETGGKQYRVEVGTELAVELLEVEPGQEITLDRVLLVADGDEAAIGRPVVDGATVSARVLRNDRAAKVISFKYKPKARRRVKKGHRQEQTVLRITDVTLNGKSAADEAKKAAEAKRTERERLEEAAAKQATADAALAATLAAKVAEAAPATDEVPKKTRTRAAKAEPKAEPAAKDEPEHAAEAPTAAEAEAPEGADSKADAAAADAPEGADSKADAAAADAPEGGDSKADAATKPKRTRAAKKED